MNNKFINEFEKFLETYFLKDACYDINNENLLEFQKSTDKLYNQIEAILPETEKKILMELEDSYQNEITEGNRLYFQCGFSKMYGITEIFKSR